MADDRPAPLVRGQGDRNLPLENAEGPVGLAMPAFAVKTGPSDQRVALRVRIQDWGWLPGHDLAAVGALAGYRSAFAGPTPLTAELC